VQNSGQKSRRIIIAWPALQTQAKRKPNASEMVEPPAISAKVRAVIEWRGLNMRRLAVATTSVLALTASVAVAQGASRDSHACRVEVLYSEELPIGPLFHYTVKAALLVTPPAAPPFETTVQTVIPWQGPPLRRGQRFRVGCDSALLNSGFGLF
jgi:hypothetical protein